MITEKTLSTTSDSSPDVVLKTWDEWRPVGDPITYNDSLYLVEGLWSEDKLAWTLHLRLRDVKDVDQPLVEMLALAQQVQRCIKGSSGQ